MKTVPVSKTLTIKYDIGKQKRKLVDELPRRYTSYGIEKKKERTEIYYKKGQIIEAFALLYAIIEQQLISIFQIKLQIDLGLKPWEDPPSLIHKWEYSQLIRVLHELHVLTEEEYQKFNLFQDGRHKAVHQLPLSHIHKKITKNNLDNSFNSGLKSYDIANSKMKSLIHDLTRKIDWDKDAGAILASLEQKIKERKQKARKKAG